MRVSGRGTEEARPQGAARNCSLRGRPQEIDVKLGKNVLDIALEIR